MKFPESKEKFDIIVLETVNEIWEQRNVSFLPMSAYIKQIDSIAHLLKNIGYIEDEIADIFGNFRIMSWISEHY